MNLANIAAVLSALLFTATAASAQHQGPNHGGTIGTCTFGSGCMSAAGDGDHVCAASTGAGQTLVVTDFGFDLPDNVGEIVGIRVEPRIADQGCQGSVQLLKDGTPVGDSVTLPSYFANSCDLTQYFFLGGNENLWNTTWTAADVEDADFGVRIDSAGCTAPIAVDTVRIAVHFTIGEDVCNDGYLSGSETCEDGNTADGDGCSARCRIEAPLDADQQKCVNGVNSGIASVRKATDKALKKCFKAHGKGTTPFLDCIGSPETNAKLEKASMKLQGIHDACEASAPPFAYTSAAEASLPAYLSGLSAYGDLVDTPPDDFVSGDKAGAACQGAVVAGKQAIAAATISSFNKCKKTALAGKKVPAADSILDLRACLPPRADGVEAALANTLATKCAGQTLDVILSGACTGSASDAERADCLAARGYCYACSLLNPVDALGLDCDILDDAEDNDSCGEAF